MKKGRSLITLLLSTITILFVVFSLAGCSNEKKPKVEDQIVEDLEAHKGFYPYGGVKIKQFKEIKRQTDIKDKTDTIFAEVVVENEDKSVSGVLSYILRYNLYNNGWILDDVKRDENGLWEIQKPADDIVIKEVVKASPFLEKYIADIQRWDIQYDKIEENGGEKYFIDYEARAEKERFYVKIVGNMTLELQEGGWTVVDIYMGDTDEYFGTGLYPYEDINKDLIEQVANKILAAHASPTGYYDTESNDYEDAEIYHKYDNKVAEVTFSVVDNVGWVQFLTYYNLIFVFDDETAEWIFRDSDNYVEENWFGPLKNTAWSCGNNFKMEIFSKDYINIRYNVGVKTDVQGKVRDDGWRLHKSEDNIILDCNRPFEHLIYMKTLSFNGPLQGGSGFLWITPNDLYFAESSYAPTKEKIKHAFEEGDTSAFDHLVFDTRFVVE